MTDPFGLDYGARLSAILDAEKAANTPPPLEPGFPWLVESFDPVFFGIKAEPVPPREAEPSAQV